MCIFSVSVLDSIVCVTNGEEGQEELWIMRSKSVADRKFLKGESILQVTPDLWIKQALDPLSAQSSDRPTNIAAFKKGSIYEDIY